MSFHAAALPAAKAAFCAGQQGAALFWEMHDWLFVNQDSWSSAQDAAAQFRTQAVALGADGAGYDTCVADAATAARIQQDIDEGTARGVRGTPNLFANEWNLWSQDYAQMQRSIEKAIQGQRPAPTPTPLPANVEFFDADPARPGFSSDGSPSLGQADAKLVLISFEDFKSAATAQHALSVEPALRAKYVDSGQMRLVVKPFAETAPRAAVAALCAARQGKFWEFRALLFEKQAEWQDGDDAAMSAYAASLDLDKAALEGCLKDEAVQAEVDYALQFGQQQIGVPATPSFLLMKLDAAGAVEDYKGLVGGQTLDQIEQAVRMLQIPQSSLPVPEPITAEKLASLPVGINADGHFYRGDPNAPIQLVEFSEFQCPFCARHQAQTAPLLDAAYVATGKVLHLFRNFPLEQLHPNAIPAAKAAYCVGQQDPKLFWQLHDWLFVNQNGWSAATDAANQFRQQALAIGADSARYDACVADAKTADAIQRDLSEGSARGVTGTPAFFVVRSNAPDQTPAFISGAQAYAQFAQTIEALLAAP